jgi:hypothetical protein
MSDLVEEKTVFDKFDNGINGAFDKLDKIPSDISDKAGEVQEVVSDKLNKVTKVTEAFADEKVATIVAGDMSKVANEALNHIDTKEISNLVSNGISAAVTAVSKGFVDGLYANPIVGSATKLGTSVLDAGGKLADTGSKIVNVVTKSVDKALLDSALPPKPPNGGGQSGGAKTRRYLKKMIRERQLIQTRTNKMIHEFMNPSHPKTMNKKYFSKKSKRRRRR